MGFMTGLQMGLTLLRPDIWLFALLLGFFLDLLLGDPYFAPHPVKFMGHLILFLEKSLRKIFPKTKQGEFFGGCVLLILVVGISVSLTILLLFVCESVSPVLGFSLQVLLSYQLLATKSLEVESKKVYIALQEKDIKKARFAVSMIVGRDTAHLNETAITKATVETVAENVSDGIVAPLIFMAMGGVPLGIFYKAVNTLDSMVGYQNEKYLYFGRCSAKVDDLLNFLPSRCAGLLLCLSAFFLGEDVRNACAIFKRDRKNHKSPNSAQTESACAGALGIQLGGGNFYFGKLVEKPTIGDNTRQITPQDILKSHKLMYGTAFLSLLIFCVMPLLLLHL